MDFRELLYYPLGVIPSVFFFIRFLYQWLASEKRQYSFTPRGFWKLSVTGNILALCHHVVQIQYPFALIQGSNAVIAWRHLNMTGPEQKKTTFLKTFLFLCFSLSLITLIFVFQAQKGGWLRIPHMVEGNIYSLPSFYLFCGMGGIMIFGMRFWIQWMRAETTSKGDLDVVFWWCSLLGALLILVYFVKTSDYVGILNYSFVLIPSIRNLCLGRNKQHKSC